MSNQFMRCVDATNLCESPVREIRTLGLSGGRRLARTIGRLLRPDTEKKKSREGLNNEKDEYSEQFEE